MASPKGKKQVVEPVQGVLNLLRKDGLPYSPCSTILHALAAN